MLNAYLTGTASLERRTGTDDYGKPVYAAAETIRCRIENRMKLITTATGEQRASNTTVYLTAEAAVGDKVNGRPVLEVAEMTALEGLIGRKVYL